MNSLPETRASLILRLRDAADLEAWDEFATVYAPVIYRSARGLGLQSADADDCVQEVMVAVAKSVEQWIERDDRGAFRAWLFRIARNRAVDFLTRRQHRPWAEGGDAAMQRLREIQAKQDVSSQFDLEFRREVLVRSSRIVSVQVSESTWEAFHRTSVLQQDVQEVAQQLGMSVGSVYIARSRVMKRLQHVVKSFEESCHDEV